MFAFSPSAASCLSRLQEPRVLPPPSTTAISGHPGQRLSKLHPKTNAQVGPFYNLTAPMVRNVILMSKQVLSMH